MTGLGDRLRHERLERGLTQKMLADRLGWPPQRVSNVERGRIGLSSMQAPTYCAALGLTETDSIQKLFIAALETSLESLFAEEPGHHPEL